MDFAQFKWNIAFIKSRKKEIIYDLWLEPFLTEIQRTKLPVIDQGCGSGNNTKYLIERNVDCIACDYSVVALRKISDSIPGVEIRLLDIRKPFPFLDKSSASVIADLSLHYFDWNTTIEIVERIRNLLVEGGLLLFRVNSINDFEYGAGKGREIEKHYYKWRGVRKRFFDSNDIDSLVEKKWQIVSKKELSINRYGKTKTAWEIAIRKE